MNKKSALIYLLASLMCVNVATYKTPVYAQEINADQEDEFDYFDKTKEEIQKYINEENYEKAKQKGKEYFINCVDFIFYDKEINGVTWNSLEESAKKEVFESFIETDKLIMEFAPDYKENISDKYKVVSKYTKEKYYKMIDIIKETIGEDKYNKVIDSKKKVTEKTIEETSKVKKRIADWYKDYKNK